MRTVLILAFFATLAASIPDAPTGPRSTFLQQAALSFVF